MKKTSVLKKVLSIYVFLAAAAASCPAFAQTSYTITDLGTLSGGTSSFARGINDYNEVVGQAESSSGYEHAFYWSNGGGMVDMGTLGGSNSYAFDINNSGIVAGTAYTTSGFHAFTWDGTSMSNRGGPYPYTSGRAINESGDVAGRVTDAGWNDYAAVWGGSSWQTINNTYMAWGINDSGQVVGVDGNPGAAFIWDSTNGKQSIGSLGNGSTAYAINNSGLVIGKNGSHGFVWDGAGVQTIVGRIAYGVNESGLVVGTGFLWDSVNDSIDAYDLLVDLLPVASGWSNLIAYDINNLGSIVGYGRINGESHAFLMSPTTAVPEPASSILLVSGGAVLGIRRFLKKQSKRRGRASATF